MRAIKSCSFKVWGLVWVVGLLGCTDSTKVDRSPTPEEVWLEVTAALAQTKASDRMQAMSASMEHLSPENIDVVRDLMDEHMEGLQQLEMAAFFDAWTEFDGLSALEYAKNIAWSSQADIAIQEVVTSWAINDFINARIVVEQEIQSNPERRAEMIRNAFVRGWAISGQSGLKEYILESSQAGPIVMLIAPRIYQYWGGDHLRDWSSDIIERSSDESIKMKVFRMTVRSVAYRDPEGQIPYVMEHYAKGEYAKDGPRVLTEHWLRTDPEAAMKWLKTEAPEETRSEGLSLAFGTWLNFHRAEARQWLDSVPKGDPYYQPAFNTLARRMAKRDPKQALLWCDRGGIGEVNVKCIRPVAVEWYKKDPVAAGIWLEDESGLSPLDLASIRQRAIHAIR